MTFIPAAPGWYYRFDSLDTSREDLCPILAWEEIEGRLNPVVSGGVGIAPQTMRMSSEDFENREFPNADVIYRPNMDVS